MDLNRVAVFLRVVQAGSFTAAAAALGTQKSSVSRSVAALEADLGIRLLQRTTRRLALTDAGRAYPSVRATLSPAWTRRARPYPRSVRSRAASSASRPRSIWPGRSRT